MMLQYSQVIVIVQVARLFCICLTKSQQNENSVLTFIFSSSVFMIQASHLNNFAGCFTEPQVRPEVKTCSILYYDILQRKPERRPDNVFFMV